MPTFKNTSEHVFWDGDLVVKPGESFTSDDEGRINQMRDQYAWQFEETKSTKDAPTEGELQEAGPTDVRELRETGHVQLDEEGKQAELVGEAATTPAKSSKK